MAKDNQEAKEQSQEVAAQAIQDQAKAQSQEAPPAEKSEYKPGVTLIKAVKKGVKVEFTASPTGLFGLAYNPGEKASFTKEQAEILIDAGVAKKA